MSIWWIIGYGIGFIVCAFLFSFLDVDCLDGEDSYLSVIPMVIVWPAIVVIAICVAPFILGNSIANRRK